ncbi:MAG: hypothetical protein KF802_13750 [Bdellovibrionaceae bacterium]|nr:hypothetical protein [Pseudobdellovibrionaceae bacterium]
MSLPEKKKIKRERTARWGLAILLVLGLASPGFAAPLSRPGEEWFLSHQEFSRLSLSQQKKYLKGVQRILGDLPNMSDHFASLPPARRGIAAAADTPSIDEVFQDLEQAEKWKGGITPFRNAQKLRDNAPEYRANFQNSMAWMAAAHLRLQKIPASSPRRAEAVERLQDLEKFYGGNRAMLESSVAPNRELANAYKTLEKSRQGDFTLENASFILDDKLVDHASKKPRVLSKGLTPAEDAAKPAQNPADSPAAATPDPAGDTAKAERVYRCMYAGFILKTDPCRGPSALPEDVNLYGFDRTKSCGAGQVICNPLVFGVNMKCELNERSGNEERKLCLAEASPVCVKRGKFATRDCSEQVTDNHLWSAATFIVSNPKSWQEYMTGFYELCDDKKIESNEFVRVRNGEPRALPQKTLKDIEQTCSSARTQLKKLAETYNGERKYIDLDRPKDSPAPPKVPDVDADGRPDEGTRGRR